MKKLIKVVPMMLVVCLACTLTLVGGFKSQPSTVFATGASASDPNAIVVVGNGKVELGENYVVEVWLKNLTETVQGVEVTLNFDTSVFEIDVEYDSEEPGYNPVLGSFNSNYWQFASIMQSVAVNTSVGTIGTTFLINPAQAHNRSFGRNGETELLLYTATFKVKADADEGRHDFTINSTTANIAHWTGASARPIAPHRSLVNLSVVVGEEPLPTHAVTFGVTGSNGTLAATVDSATITTGALVTEGKSVVFTATPTSGYRVKEWNVNGTTSTGQTIPAQTVSGPMNVTVEFELIPITHVITYSVVGGNGLISANIGASGSSVNDNGSVIFTAQPNTGFKVKEWKVGDDVQTGETNNTFTLSNITAARTVTVEFERITYAVNFSVVGNNGTISSVTVVGGSAVSDGGLVAHGSNIQFTAAPADGFRVKEWRVNNSVQSTTNPFTHSNLVVAINVTVEFEEIPAIPDYIITFSVVGENGTVTAAVVGGSSIVSTNRVQEGNDVTFTATPTTGYQVKEWRVNGTAVGTGNTYTHTDLDDNIIVTVEFELIPEPITTFTVSFNSPNGGTVVVTVNGNPITSGTLSFQEGTQIVVTLTPNDNWWIKSLKINGTSVEWNEDGIYSFSLTVNTEILIEFDTESANDNLILWILLGVAAVGGLTAVGTLFWARRKRKSLKKV
jgi:hypothetical protein